MQSETNRMAARSIDKSREPGRSCVVVSVEAPKLRRRISDSFRDATSSLIAFRKLMSALQGREADLRFALNCDSVLFTEANRVSSEAGGVAIREDAPSLDGAGDTFEDEEAVLCSLDVLAAVLRAAEALFKLTCSRRFARSASTPRSAARAVDEFADALRVDILGAVLLVRAPFLRGAAGAGIAHGLAWSSP